MHIVILGCGTVGRAAARRLISHGHLVIGVRRTPPLRDSVTPCEGFAWRCGDAADPALWQDLPRPDAVLLTATPGLRRGGDNRLDLAARAVPAGTRLVYSGTTAVYGDAAGAAVAEDGPLAEGSSTLLAVEAAVLAHADALVLRCPGLVGPTRTRVQERARSAAAAGVPLSVPGNPDRPFSILHEDDLADLLAEAVDGRLRALRGVCNAAHPTPLTVRSYYAEQARRAGVVVAIASDGSGKPARSIDVQRLGRLLPGYAWRSA